MARRLALVTGASAGLGAAFARHLASRGFDLALTARRVDRLNDLADGLRRDHGIEVVTVAADLAQAGASEAILSQIAATGRGVDVLINNAGYGLGGLYADTTWADQADFIQVMVTAPCELAHRTLPAMRDQGYGRIVNVASVAGLLPAAAGHTLYAASKAYLIRFSQSLHLEGAAHGVHVSALCPGFTYTEFHDVNGTRELADASTPGWLWLDADRVVADGWRAAEANQSICTPGLVYKLITGAARLVPESLALKLMAGQGGRFRKT
ncbi:MAG: SDR family oxidoreductase [Phenylobacterium sp.]|nr:SDR family oxidoreductase [Phenylobacterium sp.]